MSENGARRMPIRVRRVDLDGDYAGWWIDVRVNVPLSSFLDMQEADIRTALPALSQMITASNFVDDAGAPIDLSDPEGWKKCGIDLVRLVIERAAAAVRSPLAMTSAAPSSEPLSPTPEAASPEATR